MANTWNSRLWKVWSTNLPADLVEKLQASQKLVVWDGDITHANCALDTRQLATLQKNVSVFIHGAATINLQKPLEFYTRNIVHPSVMLAEMALKCDNLVRFIYVSTALANAFLRSSCDKDIDGADSFIEETIRHIRGRESIAENELFDLETFGTTPEYAFGGFFWKYSYAKHLTERLVLQLFQRVQSENRLLIFRPSCIGPAETKPYPCYEIPGAAPITTGAAIIIASPPGQLRMTSYLQTPSAATIDEIPVDMVVNRLIAHTATGTSGFVHAVAGIENAWKSEDVMKMANKARRIWWGKIKVVWCPENTAPGNISPLSILFPPIGCSFGYSQTKTEMIWNEMNDLERSTWYLFPQSPRSVANILAGREKAIASLISRIGTRKFGFSISVSTRFAHFCFKPKMRPGISPL